MNPTAEQYIAGLKKAYDENQGKESWDHFEKIKHGLAEENTQKLKTLYPEIPEALIDLLKYVDGTYWREYEGEKIAFYFLGSDMEEYPYYLLSSGEIIENHDLAFRYYADYIEGKYEGVDIDEKITVTAKNLNWPLSGLHEQWRQFGAVYRFQPVGKWKERTDRNVCSRSR